MLCPQLGRADTTANSAMIMLAPVKHPFWPFALGGWKFNGFVGWIRKRAHSPQLAAGSFNTAAGLVTL